MADRPRRVVLFLGDGAVAAAFNAVAGRLGLLWTGVARPMADATAADFEAAARVVAVDPARTEPVLRERFPDRLGAVEFWPTGDAAAVESQVMGLVTRLLGGRTAGPERGASGFRS